MDSMDARALGRRQLLARGAAVATGAALGSWAAPAIASVDLAQGAQVTPVSGLGCRMTGGGKILDPTVGEVDTFATHGFELHCNPAVQPNNLQINWGGNSFHLETLTSATCLDNPAIEPNPPDASFDTYIGGGTGKLKVGPGPFEAGRAEWTFTDGGEPGKTDTATITVFDSDDNAVMVVSGPLQVGNHQAHDTGKGC